MLIESRYTARYLDHDVVSALNLLCVVNRGNHIGKYEVFAATRQGNGLETYEEVLSAVACRTE